MTRKPVIGITSDNNDDKPAYYIGYAYCDAVVAAGGIPLMLPFKADLADIAQVVDLLDGIIFSGGNDLDPAVWGEAKHAKSTPIEPARERYERALLAEVERRRMPTLGICLGSQLMNVTRGGSMRQFIPELGLSPEMEHRKLEGKDARHKVHVEAGSVLAGVVGSGEIEANSAHKQAMGTIGRGLKVVATSPDGVVEGLEDISFPLYLGVQWHPERIHTERPHGGLFELLVRKSIENREKADGPRGG